MIELKKRLEVFIPVAQKYRAWECQEMLKDFFYLLREDLSNMVYIGCNDVRNPYHGEGVVLYMDIPEMDVHEYINGQWEEWEMDRRLENKRKECDKENEEQEIQFARCDKWSEELGLKRIRLSCDLPESIDEVFLEGEGLIKYVSPRGDQSIQEVEDITWGEYLKLVDKMVVQDIEDNGEIDHIFYEGFEKSENVISPYFGS